LEHKKYSAWFRMKCRSQWKNWSAFFAKLTPIATGWVSNTKVRKHLRLGCTLCVLFSIIHAIRMRHSLMRALSWIFVPFERWKKARRYALVTLTCTLCLHGMFPSINSSTFFRLQGRSARRFTLLKEKNFVCNCRRCLLRPNSEEERQHFLADKYLDAIACRGFSDAADKKLSSCSGYFFEVVIFLQLLRPSLTARA
jgi:hypothetical protein